MKLFSLIQLKYDEFETAIRNYLSKSLSSYGVSSSNSSVFGQLLNVIASATQNILSYIEDGITEQNKLTAQRKRSIYNLASISGYEPSTGTASTNVINLSFIPSNTPSLSVVIPNRTKLTCSQNGMTYNIILPQEVIVLSPDIQNTSRTLSIVEGVFETQTFTVQGGQLFTLNVSFVGDSDLDYLKVTVNDEEWSRMDSLYDMLPNAKQYVAHTSLKSGIDLVFGDEQNGKIINEGDTIQVTYLLHSGEYGNLDPNRSVKFEFSDTLHDIAGDDVDGNSVFNITLYKNDFIGGGTFSEDVNRVREMIGFNSRSLVLADPKNYKQFFSRFSFVGYNRTWSDTGSIDINSLIIKNFQNNLDSGIGYFDLHEQDFILSDEQKMSILNSIQRSGQQVIGSNINIIDPVITKYAIYIYIKLNSGEYDTNYISTQIRTLLGEFFSNLYSDRFVPKSDISKLIRDNVDGVDGVNVYILSEWNESALIDGHYTKRNSSGVNERVYLYDGENPGLGLDAHGNILLDESNRFPALMGGWKFISLNNGSTRDYTYVNDPVTIVFE